MLKIKRSAKDKNPSKIAAKKPKKSIKQKDNLKNKPSKKVKSTENTTQKDVKNVPKNNTNKKTDIKMKSVKKNVTKDGKINKEESESWNEFKKKMKEVRMKRKKNNNFYDVTVKAKKISEKLRMKTLKGGDEERNKLTMELHSLLGAKGNYPKFVMSHDVGRCVQYLLKFGSEQIRKEISEELINSVVPMLQSKYAKYCVKRMLKYGDAETRELVIKACFGHVVKLVSHVVSADVFEYAYTTWASSLQKQQMAQEFYGDLYKQSKDDSIKHVRDVYEKSPEMKLATLSAVRHNLERVLNKELLDSQLIHTVLLQFMQECDQTERTDLVTQLVPHIVVLSNSKEGSRLAMMCIWYGTNKDRKICIKSLKEHVVELSKHEHGHYTVLTLFDYTDDTVLINKVLLTQLISHASDLITNEWGRKVLLWLIVPGDTAYFHPTFIQELNEGRMKTTSKKDAELRRKDLLICVHASLLKLISENPGLWLSTAPIALVTFAIIKTGTNSTELKSTFESLSMQIVQDDWMVKDGGKTVNGIEHAGLHMVLKKLIQNDKNVSDGDDRPEFGSVLIGTLNDKIIKKWVSFSRGCFLFVTILESDSNQVQDKLKKLLNKHLKLIQQQDTTGAKILIKKLM